ncbi:DegT/DnrJ/EryC1/StrS family aminotransferase [Listeria aquatica]|uniref:DegT/DnrJ/EryC1/StrS family aminotransferase n=1 Tax=Listeria aquatica TaxID=1494960 RepID=UPI003EF1BAD0
MDDNKKIPLAIPHMSGNEEIYIERAFKQNWIAPLGPNVDLFENRLGMYNQAHVAATSSGTAAIHLALTLLGVTEGDYVICSTFTFVASINPALYLGAHPIFIDSEAETMNMSPEALELALQDCQRKGIQPKAIILVHLYGHSAKMDEIMALANYYQVPIIEDAAESLGSEYKGQKLGTLGEIGIFSFNGNKIITTSGGGALVSKNKNYVEKAKFLASQSKENAPYYLHQEVGYNYRLSNVLAGIGIAQLEVLEERIQKKRLIFEHYQQAFENFPQIEMKQEPQNTRSNYWLSIMLLNHGKSPQYIIEQLNEQGIEARRLWNPMHCQPLFQNAPIYTESTENIAEKLFNTGICLPSGTNMSEEELAYIEKQISKIIEK